MEDTSQSKARASSSPKNLKSETMVTIEHENMQYYRLHFRNMSDNSEIYQNVVARNLQAIRYYSKKMMTTRQWHLRSFHLVSIAGQYMCLTLYIVREKWISLHKRRRYFVSRHCSEMNTLEQFLQILEAA
jgi:hypothetical protein